VSANWEVVVIVVVIIVVVVVSAFVFVVLLLLLLFLPCPASFNRRMSATFCHMSKLITNLVHEKPAAARPLWLTKLAIKFDT
jgi:hypothetical protein